MKPEPKFTLIGQSTGMPQFRGIFIDIDKVYFDHNDGSRETARDWLKDVVKEAILETREEE